MNFVKVVFRFANISSTSTLSCQSLMFDQALETLLLRSPTEATPFLSSIVQIGNQFIKYDPVSYEFITLYG